MLGQMAQGWGSCGNCVGTTYVDSQGNATGNGTAVTGVSVGSGPDCSINGWLIAAGLGVVLLFMGKK